MSRVRHVDLNQISTLVYECLQPSQKAEADRIRVVTYLKALMKKCLAAQVFVVGRSACRLYTFADPVDISAFLCQGQEKSWFMKVSEALFQAAADSNSMFDSSDDGFDSGSEPSGRERSNTGCTTSFSSLLSNATSTPTVATPTHAGGGTRSSFSGDGLIYSTAATGSRSFSDADIDAAVLASCKVDSVRYTNAAKGQFACEIDKIPVKIAANRMSDLCHSALCEAAAAVVGKRHLFKRSLLLIQVKWTSLYCNVYACRSGL